MCKTLSPEVTGFLFCVVLIIWSFLFQSTDRTSETMFKTDSILHRHDNMHHTETRPLTTLRFQNRVSRLTLHALHFLFAAMMARDRKKPLRKVNDYFRCWQVRLTSGHLIFSSFVIVDIYGTSDCILFVEWLILCILCLKTLLLRPCFW